MVPAAVIAGIVGLEVTTISVIVATIVVNLVISAIIGKILAPKSPPGTARNNGLQTIIRNPILPRRVCYGEAITGGPYIMMETIGQANQTFNFVVAITGHPIEDVLGVFIEDQYINISGNTSGIFNNDTNDLDTNYWVNMGKFGTGEAAGHIRIIKNLGWGYADKTYVTTETTFTESINDRERGTLIRDHITTTWTQPAITGRDVTTGLYPNSGYKVTNCAHILISLLYNRDVFSGFPKIRFHIKGKRLYNPNLDSSLTSFGATGGSHDVTDGETWEWSENWSLCILDYLLDTSYGLSAIITGQLTEIDWTEAIQATQDSEELVANGYPPPDDANVVRYTTNGIFEVNATPISTMEALLTSGSGLLIYSQGTYKIRAGVYRLPSDSLDIINEDMIISPITIRTHAPRASVFNKAGGTYINSGYNKEFIISDSNKPVFEATDFPLVDPLDSSGLNPFEVIDEEERIRDFDYPFTIYEFEAQRLARIQLERARQGLAIEFEADLQVLKYSVGDTIYLEILSDSKYANEAFFNRLGLDDTVQNRPDAPFTAYYKQFTIVNMEYTENFTIRVSLLEESEEIYDWNEGDANKIDYVLESNLIIDDPTGEVLKPSWIVNSPFVPIFELNTEPNISTLVRWQAPERDSVINALDRAVIGSYELEYGIVTDSINPTSNLRVAEWISGGKTISIVNQIIQGPISLENLFVDDITNFDLRVRSITYLGRASNWAYYSEDIGSDFSPTAPRATEISIPVAGQANLTYNTQIFGSPTAVVPDWNPGEFYLSSGTSSNPLYKDVIRMSISVADVNGTRVDPIVNYMRNGDVITFFISANRWYKYILNYIQNPVSISGEVSPLTADGAIFTIQGLTLIDYKDTDPLNNDAIVSNIEFRLERDTANNDLIQLMDLDFDRSTGFSVSDPILGNFWSTGVVNSPDVLDFIVGGGEDGSNAVSIFVEAHSGIVTKINLNNDWWFRNPLKDLEISFKYQSTSGSSQGSSTGNSGIVSVTIFNTSLPDHSWGSDIADQNAAIYFPSTASGVWGTTKVILPRGIGKYLNMRLIFNSTEVIGLDLLIDSISITPVDTDVGVDTILESNLAEPDIFAGRHHNVDLTPATGNVTINMVGALPPLATRTINIKTTQDTTPRTVTWQYEGSGSPILWAGGTAPAISTGSGAEDLWTFITGDGGTTWVGSVITNIL